MRTSLVLVLLALVACLVFCAAQEVDLLSDNRPIQTAEEESDEKLASYFQKAIKEYTKKKGLRMGRDRTTDKKPSRKIDWQQVGGKLKELLKKRKVAKAAKKAAAEEPSQTESDREEYSFELNKKKLTWNDVMDLAKKAKKMNEIINKNVEVESDSQIAGGAIVRATTTVNVRSGTCTTKSVVAVLQPGQTVTATGYSGTECGYTWYGIHGPFGYGYVASNFVSVGGSPSPAPTPSPAPGPSGSGVSVDQVRRIMPNLSVAKANDYIGHLNNAMAWGSINNCLRRSAFLAQLAHESGEFRYMEEIADGSAYEGRKDLGNIYPGDGRRYKGRGPIQLTGRANYRSAGQALGVDFENNPTIVATPQWGFKVAAWYWTTRGLNGYADQGPAAFDTITRRINGGLNGKADRDKYYARARGVLGC